MTKYLIYSFLFFLLIPLICSSQADSSDSLKKYSYLIFGTDIEKSNIPGVLYKYRTVSGTGFFIRKKDAIYFITAKHVFSGCDFYNEKHKTVHALNIWIPEIKISIPIINNYYDSAICIDMSKDADVLAFKIDSKWSKYINSLESFVHDRFKKVSNTEICGYLEKIMDTTDYFSGNPIRLNFKNKDFTLNYRFNLESKQDSINYDIIYKSVFKNDSLEGFSGSPVFFQDHKSKKWRIGGVFVAGEHFKEDRMGLVVVELENVFKRIDELDYTLINAKVK